MNLLVEGNRVVNELTTTTAKPFVQPSVIVDVTDGAITIEIGGKSSVTNNFAYTFIQFCDIEVVN